MGTSPAIHLWTVRYGNDVAITLPLEVFTQENFSRLLSTEVKLHWQKQQNRVCATFWGLRGNVHGSSLARWKARGRLSIISAN